MKPLAEHVRETPFVVCAHRGASGVAPENTIAAICAAIDAGAEMVEIDVQVSGDGQFVVFHDDELERTTNGKGLVEQHSFESLRTLDAGAWFHARFAGERIPLLADALEVLRGRAYLNIEIKPMAATSQRAAMLARVIGMVRDAGLIPYTVFSSFDHAALLYVKSVDPMLHTNALNIPGDSRPPHVVVSECRADGYGCSIDEVSAAIVEDAHRHFIPIGVYTVNTEQELFAMLDLGVNGVVTNYPNVIMRALAAWKEHH